MPAYPVIDTAQLRAAAARVKEIDPQIRKELIKGLKSDLRPMAAAIVGEFPPALGRPGAMRGFGHGGRTAWSKVSSSVHVTPGGGKGSVARIEIFGAGDGRAAVKIVDLAGTRQLYNDGNYSKRGAQLFYLINGQGRDMVSRLTQFARLSAGGKGGRFAWSGFMKYRPQLIDAVIRRMDTYAQAIANKAID